MAAGVESLATINRPIESINETVRVNLDMEELVNRALAVAYLVGLKAGVEMMREGGVPFHVVTRVMLHPEQRREGDWKH
jgi:hypothetical protein